MFFEEIFDWVYTNHNASLDRLKHGDFSGRFDAETNGVAFRRMNTDSVWRRIAIFCGIPLPLDGRPLFESRHPAVFALKCLFAPFRLARNILKLVTEYLPLIVYIAAYQAIRELPEGFSLRKLGLYAALGLGYVVYLVGSRLTSPIKSFKQLIYDGHPVWAGISLFFSIALYAALFPIAVYYLAPAIAAHAPAFMAGAIHAIASAYQAVSTAMGAALGWIGSVINTIGLGLPLAVGLPMADIGLLGMLGLTVYGVVSAVTVVTDKLEDPYAGTGKPSRIEWSDKSSDSSHAKTIQGLKANPANALSLSDGTTVVGEDRPAGQGFTVIPPPAVTPIPVPVDGGQVDKEKNKELRNNRAAFLDKVASQTENKPAEDGERNDGTVKLSSSS